LIIFILRLSRVVLIAGALALLTIYNNVKKVIIPILLENFRMA